MIKLVFLFHYPEGVPFEEGEKWYLGTHTQEAKHLKGLVKYVTWRVRELPGRPTKWHRVTELWFDYESPEDWIRYTNSPEYPKFTAAPYGPRGFIAEVICVNTEPQYDILKQIPPVPK